MSEGYAPTLSCVSLGLIHWSLCLPDHSSILKVVDPLKMTLLAVGPEDH